jgi:23S rRNA pseudouridine955/2504/2580 synthase
MQELEAAAAGAAILAEDFLVCKESVTQHCIDDSVAGQRLDNFLMRVLKGVPKSHVYRILRSGEVRVNKGRRGPEYRLALGDVVRIPPVRVAEKQATGPMQSSLLPRIVWRDESMLVLDKPAGQAVHGGSGVSLGIVEQLREELDARYLELAHRLDKETSGLLILCTRRSALTALHEMLRRGEVHKRYLALAAGHWRDAKRNVRLPLLRFEDAEGERRVRVDEAEGQSAHTVFYLQQRYALGDERLSLLECELLTGRTHQIRVHLSALKHPIAGDTKYGDPALNRSLRAAGLRRMFLHAARLQFRHPLSGEAIDLGAPLPPDLAKFTSLLSVIE